MRPWTKVKVALLGASLLFFLGAILYFWIIPGPQAIDTSGASVEGRGPSLGAVGATLIIGGLLATAAWLSFRQRRWIALTILAPLWAIALLTFIPGGVIVWIPLLLTTVASLLPVGGPESGARQAPTD